MCFGGHNLGNQISELQKRMENAYLYWIFKVVCNDIDRRLLEDYALIIIMVKIGQNLGVTSLKA